jgi:hypothetical protein
MHSAPDICRRAIGESVRGLFAALDGIARRRGCGVDCSHRGEMQEQRRSGVATSVSSAAATRSASPVSPIARLPMQMRDRNHPHIGRTDRIEDSVGKAIE